MHEHLVCAQDVNNRCGLFAVAVLQGWEMVHHILKKSAPCFLFLRRGGSIQSQVTRNCRYSKDLPCLVLVHKLALGLVFSRSQS